VRSLADRNKVTQGLSKATARCSFQPVHDRGRVIAEVAVMLAEGGKTIANINVLRRQGQGAGPGGIGADGAARTGRAEPAAWKRIELARGRTPSPLEEAGAVAGLAGSLTPTWVTSWSWM
jgi:hypothetical protein